MLHQIFSVSNTKHSEKYIYYNLLAYFLPLLLLLAGLNSDIEALAIQDANDDSNVLLLNQKGEWGQRGIPRLRVDQ